jgi:hypothetical protein
MAGATRKEYRVESNQLTDQGLQFLAQMMAAMLLDQSERARREGTDHVEHP